MKLNLSISVLVCVATGSLGLIIGIILPRARQDYGIVVVTGTTIQSPAMDEYVEKFDGFLEKQGAKSWLWIETHFGWKERWSTYCDYEMLELNSARPGRSLRKR